MCVWNQASHELIRRPFVSLQLGKIHGPNVSIFEFEYYAFKNNSIFRRSHKCHLNAYNRELIGQDNNNNHHEDAD